MHTTAPINGSDNNFSAHYTMHDTQFRSHTHNAWAIFISPSEVQAYFLASHKQTFALSLLCAPPQWHVGLKKVWIGLELHLHLGAARLRMQGCFKRLRYSLWVLPLQCYLPCISASKTISSGECISRPIGFALILLYPLKGTISRRV